MMSRIHESNWRVVGRRRSAAAGKDVPIVDRIDSFFARLGVRGRVVASQLPLTVTVVLVVAAAAVFSPTTLADDRFRVALLAHAALFGLCVTVPWKRLPAGTFTVIPVLDCVAIGFTREAGGPGFNILSLLLVFPVVWLSIGRARARVCLAVLGIILSTVVPAAAMGAAPGQGSMIRTIFLPLIMSAIAVTAHLVAGALHRQRQHLAHKDRALADTLTESVRRQRLLNAVLSAVGVGVWVVDQHGQHVLTNRTMRADPALVRLAHSAAPPLLFHADRTTPVAPEWSPDRRAARGETFSDELYWAGEEGEQRAFSVSAHPVETRNGTCAGAVITFADVTALINALTAKDDFVGTVSHELRTPLTSILGYLELVLDEPGHRDIEPELRIVQRNATHLLGLVNDLIAVASKRIDLTPQETDFARLLDEAVASERNRAVTSRVELVLAAEEALPAWMDRARMTRVVRNLLSNAIKYTPNGGTVTVRAHRSGPKLVCSISDTGVGMSTDEQEQAFTKFFRSARSRGTAIPGAGLGLPISKTVIEGHGGSISLTSAPGAGTTVTFTIPLTPHLTGPATGLQPERAD